MTNLRLRLAATHLVSNSDRHHASRHIQSEVSLFTKSKSGEKTLLLKLRWSVKCGTYFSNIQMVRTSATRRLKRIVGVYFWASRLTSLGRGCGGVGVWPGGRRPMPVCYRQINLGPAVPPCTGAVASSAVELTPGHRPTARRGHRRRGPTRGDNVGDHISPTV